MEVLFDFTFLSPSLLSYLLPWFGPLPLTHLVILAVIS